MALVEYGSGCMHSFIFIPEENEGRDGGGWRRHYGSVWLKEEIVAIIEKGHI